MPLFRLTYVSTSISSRPTELNLVNQEIVSVAAARNRERSITGALVLIDRFYIQTLEGPRVSVCEIYNRIACDDRHERVELIGACHPSERRFPEDDLIFGSAISEHLPMLAKYQVWREFCPYSISPESLELLTDEIFSHVRSMQPIPEDVRMFA